MRRTVKIGATTYDYSNANKKTLARMHVYELSPIVGDSNSDWVLDPNDLIAFDIGVGATPGQEYTARYPGLGSIDGDSGNPTAGFLFHFNVNCHQDSTIDACVDFNHLAWCVYPDCDTNPNCNLKTGCTVNQAEFRCPCIDHAAQCSINNPCLPP